MRKFEDVFTKNLPTIDLHGYDRESARVATNDFVDDAVKMGYDKIVIIHGIGSGAVKESVHHTLAKNRLVVSYQLNGMNVGCTVVNVVRKER